MADCARATGGQREAERRLGRLLLAIGAKWSLRDRSGARNATPSALSLIKVTSVRTAGTGCARSCAVAAVAALLMPISSSSEQARPTQPRAADTNDFKEPPDPIQIRTLQENDVTQG